MLRRDHTDQGVEVGFHLAHAFAGIGDKALDLGNFEESLQVSSFRTAKPAAVSSSWIVA